MQGLNIVKPSLGIMPPALPGHDATPPSSHSVAIHRTWGAMFIGMLGHAHTHSFPKAASFLLSNLHPSPIRPLPGEGSAHVEV